MGVTTKKKSRQDPRTLSGFAAAPVQPMPARTRAEQYAAGKALRATCPREAHATWKAPADRRDAVELVLAAEQGRVQDLLPLRHGRMVRSAFTFYRGAALTMATDLASTPGSGIRVQCCGDAHLCNFGGFATPERNVIFSINDLDETLPAPWEWDVKRLTVSFAVAARDNGHSDDDARESAVECVRAYREHLRECSKKSPLDVWYERLDIEALLKKAPDAEARKRRADLAERAHKRIGEYLFPKVSAEVHGRRRLVDQPPVLFHVNEPDGDQIFLEAMAGYRQSLPEDRQVLFDRYRLEDWAVKVVGIGSVGTRCLVGLFFSSENYPLLLQFKEARRSVLEPYAGKSIYENQGQRVVVGQRLMQSSSDIFLGWTEGRRGRHFFGRQLRDMKLSAPVEGASPALLKLYAEVCGLTLARAHAKSGDAATISGYLGKSDAFDQAIGSFALAYADQNERDHAALVAAVKAGRVEALVEEDL